MPEHTLFHVVFLFQILLVSYVLPRRILGHMKEVFDTYPPSSYPKLYPRSEESYARSRRRYRIVNRVVLVAGFVLFAVLLRTSRSGEWDHAFAAWYFLLQCLPLILLDLSSLREARLMRELSTTRKAELRPRRLLDYLPSTLFALALVTYLGFVLLVVYVDRFEFPWFGGYANVVGITIGNLFFAGIIVRQVYGKKRDPLQANEDRDRAIRTVVTILLSVSIGATVFVALQIALQALDLRAYRPVAQSLYFQLLAALCIRGYLIRFSDYDVYRDGEQPVAGTVLPDGSADGGA